MMRRSWLVALGIVLAPAPAFAAHWNVDYGKSRLGFTVMWSNEPFSAAFRSWKADIDFDPSDLAHSSAVVTVDLASEASDESDFDDGLKGAQGFQTSKFPMARFATGGFARKSGNDYVAAGTLSLRGVTRGITLPFTLTATGRTAHMTGTAHVLRTDFGVGQGIWAASDPVSHDVTITVDVTASEVP